MGRAPCCDKSAVKKGPWSPEEDDVLKSYIEKHGTGGNWISLPQKIGIKRCGKSCRLRWLNYLRPNLKHGGFTDEEDYIICSLYISIGSRWSIIASQLPGRTDNDIKNYWNTKLKKKLLNKQGKIFQKLNVKFEPETTSKRSMSNQNQILMFHNENIKPQNQILDQSSYFGMEEQSLIKNPIETFSWEANKVWYDHDNDHHHNSNVMNGLLGSSSSPSLNSISSSCSISTTSSLQMSPYTLNTNHQDMFLTGLENLEAELLNEKIVDNTEEIEFRRGIQLQKNNFWDHDISSLIDYVLDDNNLFKSR